MTFDLGRSAQRHLAAEAEDPGACTLDAEALPVRLEEWRAMLDRATSRAAGPDGTVRVEFAPDMPLRDLADLVEAEQRCCAFFSFTITVDHRGVGLEIGAPEGAQQAVTALFGAVP